MAVNYFVLKAAVRQVVELAPRSPICVHVEHGCCDETAIQADAAEQEKTMRSLQARGRM